MTYAALGVPTAGAHTSPGRGGTQVQTNGQALSDPADPRSSATWVGAVRQLVDADLLEARGFKGNVFRVTDLGFHAADELRGMQ